MDDDLEHATTLLQELTEAVKNNELGEAIDHLKALGALLDIIERLYERRTSH